MDRVLIYMHKYSNEIDDSVQASKTTGERRYGPRAGISTHHERSDKRHYNVSQRGTKDMVANIIPDKGLFVCEFAMIHTFPNFNQLIH